MFKFHIPKVLPTVYNDALSYYEVLCKLAYKIEEVEKEIKPIYMHNLDIVVSRAPGARASLVLYSYSPEKITKTNRKNFIEENVRYCCSGVAKQIGVNLPDKTIVGFKEYTNRSLLYFYDDVLEIPWVDSYIDDHVVEVK